MRLLLPFLLLATCTWDGGSTTAQCELTYANPLDKPYFVCGQGILPRYQVRWIDGVRVEIIDGRAR